MSRARGAHRTPAIAEIFDVEKVADMVHTFQRGEIGSTEFLRRIIAAGCASHRVFIDSRKAMYFGRNREVEPVPARAN